MAGALKTIIYPVADLARARARFAALLGAEPYVDQPWYVAFDARGQDVGLDPNGYAQGARGAVGYWHTDDIEQSIKRLAADGAVVTQPVKDVGEGRRVATVRDVDGNLIGLIQDP